MSNVDPLPAHKVQTRIKRLTKSQVLEATGPTGAYELADQGLQILLGEPLDRAIEGMQKKKAQLEAENDPKTH